MILNRKIKKKLKNVLRKSVSLFLAFAILAEITYPTQVFALTGGPSQPEVQSFEPVGTSDMVDLATGDFNYNIPLLDVDGYPINIAYHGGITMDQEASWVGLGWNINPGVINRNMRGLPDDFSGDAVTKEINIKPNKTWGVATDINAEIYGFNGTVGYSYGFNFNNYTGPSISKGISTSITASKGSASATASLGLNSSSDAGLDVQASQSFSIKKRDEEGHEKSSLGGNIGTSFNSRGGLKQLTIGAQASNALTQKMGRFTKFIPGVSNVASGGLNFAASFDMGMPTYTPNIATSMKNHAISGKFSVGGEIYGLDIKAGLSGFYSSQKVANTTILSPAYGYMYSENGQANDNSLMDFNREKEGTFTENTAFLPIANSTYDTYSVSGQGAGGSYRPFRSDVGYVFDPAAYTTNDDAAITMECGIGGWVHLGTDITITDVNGKSGKWKDNNASANTLLYSKYGKNPDYESVYFKEANEKTIDSDTSFYASVGNDKLILPHLDISGKFEHPLGALGPVKRAKRDKRTQSFSFLKRSDYAAFAVQPVNGTYASSPHHIAEITTLGADGSRYVYGIAAYNTIQKDVTFSVGSTNPLTVSNKLIASDNASPYDEATTGLIKYTPLIDNSKHNTNGTDNYFSSTTTPAYAHSYLLTSVLSADYVDADNIRGPSDNDFGNYTQFIYKKMPSNYKWRIPYEANTATYTEGLKSDLQDDKANYVYGEKELWYLDTVVTKNYIAVFYKSDRDDALGVEGENGGYNAMSSQKMQRLDSIRLFSKPDFRANPGTAVPLKCVHFEYSYALCGNIPNVPGGVPDPSTGKLTLKKIYFSYQNSNKARLTPYIFDYHENNSAENPQYNIKSYDRWGYYKKNEATVLGVRGSVDVNSFASFSNPIPPSDFPYVEQDTSITNDYMSAWSLKEIQLPSGGKIKVTYESDDYAYVQNQPAMQMFKIVNYDSAGISPYPVVNFATGGGKFYFPLQDGITDMHKYMDGITDLYFRCLVKIRDVGGYNHLEYVSGYGDYDGSGVDNGLGWVKLKSIRLKDDGSGTNVNPVVKTAIQYGKLYMPKKVWTQNASSDFAEAANIENSSGMSFAILDALVNSSFAKNIKAAIVGPDQFLYDDYSVAQTFVAQKSWLRLNNPNKHKLGGGLRVKKIEMSDEWGKMTGNDPETANYGQEYTYTLDDGSSSGVASYEPMLGGDENPFRQPIYTTVKKRMVPDDRSYQELPVGECFYPSPNVCYSMVTVKNLQRSGVTRHATGKVVNEFYTAKDFPTISGRTNLVHKRGKSSPFGLASLLKINVKDYLSAAQGFEVEQNDMHGKPKSQKIYQEGQSTPISSIEYKYKQESYLSGGNKLVNKCTVIDKSGKVSVARIGEFYDMVADFREDKTSTNTAGIQFNIDIIPGGPIPIPVPMLWPTITSEKTRFRSATTTKVIQRFGILEEIVATDLGSIVSTKNLAYDSETGDVLLTQTTTNYNDIVYNLKYPAWWYYQSMGPAYQNIGFEMGATFSAGVCNTGTGIHNLAGYFREGDEVALNTNIGNIKGWVTEVGTNSITVVQKNGDPVNGSYHLKIIRSGQRNMTTVDMATITTLSNPLSSIKSNIYENVLQASAIEFSNRRKSFCDCEITPGSNIPYTSNEYVLGKKGSWRPLRSYTHLTERSHSNYDNNTNIRKDGVFSSYSPYYKWTGEKWSTDPHDWTAVSEVTAFNSIGEELENKDALGRFSSATFGYNQSMATSVAANSMQKEQAFDGFEDYHFSPCADSHFKVDSVTPVSTESHTGKYSLKISSGAPKTVTRQLTTVCNDSTGCLLTLNATVVSPTVYTITSSLGEAPYSYDWKITTGSPAIAITSTGLKITGSAFTTEVTITDNKGCSTTQKITH